MSRSRQAPKLAYELSQRFDIRWVEARYEGPKAWTLEWGNGPTVESMRTAVAELAPSLSPAIPPAEWRYSRGDSPLAYAVQLLRVAQSGQIPAYASRHDISWLAENAVNHTDFPDRAASERDQEMARRLVAESDGEEYTIAQLVHERGIAWLLDNATTGEPGTEGGDDGAESPPVPADPDDPRTALEVLTQLYASGPEIKAWQRQMQTLPVREAIDRAIADPALPHRAVAASLILVPELRKELDQVELTLLERGRAVADDVAPMSWERIGRALGGITHQAAQQRANRLRDGTPRRRTSGTGQ